MIYIYIYTIYIYDVCVLFYLTKSSTRSARQTWLCWTRSSARNGLCPPHWLRRPSASVGNATEISMEEMIHTYVIIYIYICTYIHILYIRTDTHIMYTKALPDRILSSVQRSTILREKPSLQVRIFYLFKVSSKMLISRIYIYIYEIVDISSL